MSDKLVEEIPFLLLGPGKIIWALLGLWDGGSAIGDDRANL